MSFDTPIHTNSQSIDRVLAAGLPVVLVFWRPDCAPCRLVEPVLHRLASDYAGKLLFAKIQVDDEPDLRRRFGIAHLPTLLLVPDAAALSTARVTQLTGALAEADLRRWCDYLCRGGERPAVLSGPSVPVAPAAAVTPPPPPPAASAAGKPITLTDATFDSIIHGDLPVLVDFWAAWCGPCRMIAPTIEALAAELTGNMVVGKLNVDENQRTASRYGIMSIPTLLIFRQGKVVDQIVGALPAAALRQRVLPHLGTKRTTGA